MSDLRTRPMTEPEFAAFTRAGAHAYAAAKVAAGQWPAAGAIERAEQDTARHLPDGLATAGTSARAAEHDGEVVGRVWIGPDPGKVADNAWIYVLEVDPAHRGRGYGRALLAAAKAAAKAHGYPSIGLNVFGANTAARALYDSAGYTPITMQLAKPLA